jgi:hypothetical protein
MPRCYSGDVYVVQLQYGGYDERLSVGRELMNVATIASIQISHAIANRGRGHEPENLLINWPVLSYNALRVHQEV